MWKRNRVAIEQLRVEVSLERLLLFPYAIVYILHGAPALQPPCACCDGRRIVQKRVENVLGNRRVRLPSQMRKPRLDILVLPEVCAYALKQLSCTVILCLGIIV